MTSINVNICLCKKCSIKLKLKPCKQYLYIHNNANDLYMLIMLRNRHQVKNISVGYIILRFSFYQLPLYKCATQVKNSTVYSSHDPTQVENI